MSKKKRYLLKKYYPHLCKEWDYEKNKEIGLDINKITHSSGKRARWNCLKCGLSYEAIVFNRTRGSSCPYCSGRRATKTSCLKTTYPKLIKREWNFEKNNELGLTPENVSYGSSKKVYWICLKCKSSYKNCVSQRTIQKQGCPYCGGQKVNGTNSLESKCSELLKEWNYEKNNELGINPGNVVKGSTKQVYWNCPKCKSLYMTSILSRTRCNSKCPYCAGQKVNHTNSLRKTDFKIVKE